MLLTPVEAIKIDSANETDKILFLGKSPYAGYLCTLTSVWLITISTLVTRYIKLIPLGRTYKEQISIERF